MGWKSRSAIFIQLILFSLPQTLVGQQKDKIRIEVGGGGFFPVVKNVAQSESSGGRVVQRFHPGFAVNALANYQNFGLGIKYNNCVYESKLHFNELYDTQFNGIVKYLDGKSMLQTLSITLHFKLSYKNKIQPELIIGSSLIKRYDRNTSTLVLEDNSKHTGQMERRFESYFIYGIGMKYIISQKLILYSDIYIQRIRFSENVDKNGKLVGNLPILNSWYPGRKFVAIELGLLYRFEL